MALTQLVLATGNAHKLREVRQILGDRFEILSQQEAGFDGEVEEDGATFEENALKKAQAVADALSLPALADDSGLEVDALSGAPGVHSARYCGVHGRDDLNNEKLLRELDGLPPERRTARYVCAMAMVRPGLPPVVTRGTMEGRIGSAYRGTGGFGYDPLFITAGGRTAAELTPEEKNAVSHRGQALRLLRQALEDRP